MSNRKTPLYDEHVKLGAKIIDFHGWDMPLQYTRILEEHMAVRERVGIFDVSHMGDIIVEGPDAKDFMDHMFPTKVSDVKKGEATYTAFLNNDGKIIDDTIVYRMEEDKFFFVPNASMIGIIRDWLNRNKGNYNITVKNVSYDIACIAIQGPRSGEIVAKLDLPFPDQFKFIEVKGNFHENALTGNKTIIVSGTGYTGETGVEILVPSEDSVEMWKRVLNLVTEESGLPCGLGARDTLRMEKGMLLSGTDFHEDRNPYECSISFIVNNDSDYIGKEAIREKGDYIFRSFKLDGKLIPRSGSEVFFNGQKIGVITSGTLSPVLDSAISLGFIKRGSVKTGTTVSVSIRGKMFDAEVGKPKIVP